MRTKRLLRMMAFLLSLCMCAAMHPSIVSAEESNPETYDQGLLYNIYDFEAQDADDGNVAGIPVDSPLIVNSTRARNAALVGVTNLGHNHSTGLSNIRTNLTNCGFNNAYLYTGAFSVTNINTYLDTNSNKVFVSRSHGNYLMNSYFPDEQDCTYLVLNDNSSAEVRYCSNGSMGTLDLHNLELAMFIGCYTAYGGTIENNLVTQAVLRGATAAVGFTDEIACNEATVWMERLFALLEQGHTLRNACQTLHVSHNFQETTIACYLIYGNTSITLTS